MRLKKAYRNLSRKYHPDANINNPNKAQAEERFKEIQQAYKQIMDEKENGYYNNEWSGFGTGSYYSGQGMGGQNSSSQDVNSMHLRAAANYINSSYYREALNVLAQMQEKNGQWYYLSAIANAGLGNNILAIEYAKQQQHLSRRTSSLHSLYTSLSQAVCGTRACRARMVRRQVQEAPHVQGFVWYTWSAMYVWEAVCAAIWDIIIRHTNKLARLLYPV